MIMAELEKIAFHSSDRTLDVEMADMNYYVTLFDSGYLTRGLALYNSLLATGEIFTLFIVAFDDLAYDILVRLNLKQARIISLYDFEGERLLAVKPDRTRQEYSWTCGSFSILYILENFNVPQVTYLDADTYFWSKPSLLLDELKAAGRDVLITEHRYTEEYDQTATSGKFCVQFMTFNNTPAGLKVLNWWCDACEKWCYARFEDGKFGDQKYLDDWETRFADEVYVLKNIGGGVAPWNVQQYSVTGGPKVNGEQVVFFHFHALKCLAANKFDLSQYKLDSAVIKYIYQPYVLALKAALAEIKAVAPDFSERYTKPQTAIDKIRYAKECLKRRLKGTYNVVEW